MKINKFFKIKTIDIFKKILNWHPLAIIFLIFAILLIIAINDFIIIGGQILQCPQFTKAETIQFYFGRSLAEFLMFGLGVLLGYKIGEDTGLIQIKVKK